MLQLLSYPLSDPYPFVSLAWETLPEAPQNGTSASVSVWVIGIRKLSHHGKVVTTERDAFYLGGKFRAIAVFVSGSFLCLTRYGRACRVLRSKEITDAFKASKHRSESVEMCPEANSCTVTASKRLDEADEEKKWQGEIQRSEQDR